MRVLRVFVGSRPTFYRICKKKSTEGFQAIPYAVGLFSDMLYLYYAFLKKNAVMLVTINIFGCIIEVAYLAIYMFYATKKARVILVSFFFSFFGRGVMNWWVLIYSNHINN